MGRSREGAWIEIPSTRATIRIPVWVAPVRERGLKSMCGKPSNYLVRRSREGAWIEMLSLCHLPYQGIVAPVRERGLKYKSINFRKRFKESRSRKGAWIEI